MKWARVLVLAAPSSNFFDGLSTICLIQGRLVDVQILRVCCRMDSYLLVMRRLVHEVDVYMCNL